MSTNPIKPRLLSLRVRLGLFYAGLITLALLLFGAAVYVTAVVSEAEEDEPQADKDREIAAIRQRLLIALGAGIPAAVLVAGVGSSFMTRRTLRALGDIVATANTVGPDRLHPRLPSDERDDAEIQHLTFALNQMLDRVDRAVTGLRRFTADAAHELRTPLSSLLGAIEICLRRPRDSDALRAVLEDTMLGLGSLARLVEVLLMLARSDAGELPIARKEVDLEALLATVISPYEGVAAELGLTLRRASPPPGLRLSTDALLLGRALANLLDNACKFTPTGGTVEVLARASGDSIEVVVRDSGPGLSEQDQDQLFQRFYRGAAHRGSTEGFGVGLALSREFISALGGSLRLSNRASGGTEAIVTLARQISRA